MENEYTDSAGHITHSAALVPMTSTALMLLMARSANYLKWDGRLNGGQGGYKRVRPPDKLVETVLFNRVGWPFDTVRGVLSCPTMRPDGSLLTEPGYDPSSRYYLMFPSNLVMPDIPDEPTMNDARAALARLLRLLENYPFVGTPSKAVALCILMTQVLRCAMPVSPLLAVSAKAPGSGKSHLVDLASTIAVGRPCPSMGAGSDKKETEKEINTMMLSGVPGFTIDNVSSDIDLPLLNRVTSQTHLSIRIFGKLEQVEVENAVVIYMTGNNLAIVDEQRRRSMRCEIDVGEENPERREFEIDPIQTVLADRGRYIADVLTISRAYHVSKKKSAPYPLNGYEAWSHFVREPLIWLGQADPCASMDETGKDDPATIRLHAMVEGWSECIGVAAMTAAQAVSRANLENDKNDFYQTLKEQFPTRGGADVDTTRMGYWLRKFAGRVANGKRFARDEGVTNGAARWKIEYI
jgi:putative DNA primase/helicase